MKNEFIFPVDQEIKKICDFLVEILRKAGKEKIVIASSGGIDSSVSLALSVRAVGPENVIVLALPYKDLNVQGLQLSKKLVTHFNIPSKNFHVLDIASAVDVVVNDVENIDKYRKGNIMARIRMVYLFDYAKENNALVVGTENKSEYYLGYFTRFGDEASDIEPIQNFYKTQIYMIAHTLGIPDEIISQNPTAGLWDGQTDEGQFRFTYKEADQVLSLHFDKGVPFINISEEEFPNKIKVQKIIEENDFKHHVPFVYSHSLDEGE